MTPTLDQLHEYRTATDMPLFSGLPVQMQTLQ